MTPMPSERNNAKRWWWQFGLRELLVWTLASGLAIGWWLDHRRLTTDTILLRIEMQASADEVSDLQTVLSAVQRDLAVTHGLELNYEVQGDGGMWLSIKQQ